MPAYGPGDTPPGAAVKKAKKKRLVKKPPAPTPTQTKSSKAQAQQYASQGKAVEKVANQQRATAKRKSAEVKDTKGASEFKRAESFKKTPKYQRDSLAAGKAHADRVVGTRPDWKDPAVENLRRTGLLTKSNSGYALKGATSEAISKAPVLKVLEQTTRPLHAVAGGTKAAIEGKDVGKAALRGLENKDKTGFGEVLQSAGVKNKAIRGIGGFVGDVVGDPTTYISGGGKQLAEKEAQRAGAQAIQKATKAGMSEAGVENVAKTAAKRAEAGSKGGKGIQFRFAGKNIGGVKPTAAVHRAVGKATSKVLPKTRATVRRLAHEVRPMIRPTKDISEKQYRGIRNAQSRQRALTHKFERQAEREAGLLHGAKLTDEEHTLIIDSIERGPRAVRKIKDPKLRKVAQDLQAVYKGEGRIRRQAGVSQGQIGRKRLTDAERLAEKNAGKAGNPRDVLKNIEDVMRAGESRAGRPKGYYPHEILPASEEEAFSKYARGTGAKPQSAMRREGKGTLAEENAARAGKGKEGFSTHVPLTRQNYGTATGRAVGRLSAVKEIAGVGRRLNARTKVVEKNGVQKVKRVWDDPNLKQGEALYELANVDGRLDLRAVEKPRGKGKRGVQYVVLNRHVVENALRPEGPGRLMNSESIRVYDRATRGFKILATGTLGFHIRNLIGDTHMHYNAAGATGMAKNYRVAGKAVRAQSIKETHHVLGGGNPEFKGTIKVGGKDTPVADYLKELEDNGIARGGLRAVDVKYTTEELAGKKAEGKFHARAPKNLAARAGRWMQNREDLARVATYTHFRNKGFNPAEARRLTHEGPHPDYGDLSVVEKDLLRRVAPFYTFTARNAPFQVKTLIQHPGRVAVYQKIIENASKTFGGNPEDYNDYTQQNIPVSIPGKKGIQWSDPMNVLENIPVSPNPVEYGQTLMHTAVAMVNPWIKDPVEFFNNYSFFRGQPLSQPDRSNLVPAPAFAGALPDSLKQKIGIVEGTNKRSGEKNWMWPAKVDYAARATPGLVNLVESLATRGSTTPSGPAKYLSIVGVKVTPQDKLGVQMAALYKLQQGLNSSMDTLRKQGINADHPNAEYKQLLYQNRVLSDQIHKLSVARGDAISLKASPGRKAGPQKIPLGGGSTGHKLPLDGSSGTHKLKLG